VRIDPTSFAPADHNWARDSISGKARESGAPVCSGAPDKDDRWRGYFALAV